jgi:alkylresorcinol/alkylpyrone synthase
VSRIAAVAPALPDHVYPQQEITATIAPLITTAGSSRRAVLGRLHAACGVATRALAMPLDRYAGVRGFTEANDLFLELGRELAIRAVKEALARASVRPDEVDLIVFTTVTGVSAPSMDALIAQAVGLREDVRRIPMFGLGCVAGASGIARVHDHLVGHPDDVALLVSVELCSLTLQHGDDSMANIVSSGLFGDGASAVVMVGDARVTGPQGPEVLGSVTHLFPGTADELGWDVGGTGFRIVLSASLADIVEAHLAADVDRLLAAHGYTRFDVTTWIAHAGGPKILDAAQRALGLPDEALAASRASLARVGNISSSSVLHVLADTAPPPGGIGVMFAFGPGVTDEVVLLRWPEAP